jgi:PadR family transcriptional regulator, regulatory protein PadR
MANIRRGAQRLKVLTALIEGDGREMSGADIMRSTDLASGTVYPILYAFEEVGLLDSRWESEDPQLLGRPQRCLYRLTALGESTARDWILENQALVSRLRAARAE